MVRANGLNFIAICFCALCASDGALAQTSGNTLRDLFRTYVKLQSTEAKKVLDTTLENKMGVEGGVNSVVALQYEVLLRDENGKEMPVDPRQKEFQIGDQIRVRIQPLNDMYIYIFHEGASGHKTCLLPTEEEKAPAAKAGEALQLPDDGYFEFGPPTGEEKLIVVATEKPIKDLASLSNVVFKKPDEELTPDEKKIKKKLKATGLKTLQSIRKRQAAGTTYRGLISDEALNKFSQDLKKSGTSQGTLEEPPHDKETSAFVMAASNQKNRRPDLFVSIPLKSTK